MVLTVSSLAAQSLALARKANAPYEPADPEPFGFSENLFLDAETTATHHVWFSLPRLAVDGHHDSPGQNWCGGEPPSSLQIDLRQPRELNAIRLWTYWGDGRSYSYYIETSQDGTAWEAIVDRRDNRVPATAEGETFLFPARRPRYVRTTITGCSAENNSHIVEIEGYCLPEEMVAKLQACRRAWEALPAGLQGSFGSKDVRYSLCDAPTTVTGRVWRGSGWRGERLATQLVLWTSSAVGQLRLECEPPHDASGHSLGAGAIKARFVRSVLADGCLVADVLDDAEALDLPAQSVRTVWLSVDIPTDATPGLYRTRVVARAQGGLSIDFDCEIEVLALALPSPREWKFHLDLWQNPFAVARLHRVKPWSPEHFSLLKPHLQMLADAGQKCLTVTVVDRPWGTQTYDPYDSMVRWIRHRDGSWDFDFSILDRYVDFAATCGLDQQIDCYSVLPWTATVAYWDEASGEPSQIVAKTGTPAYAETWAPFLRALERHAREKGWIGRLYLGADEVPTSFLQELHILVRKEAPGLKLASGGHNDPVASEFIDDWCVGIVPKPVEPAEARRRAATGRKTTFYVCCAPDHPNTFLVSPPAEAEWLGIYAAAMDYSGFLRWAYDCWTEDPLYDTSHVTWPAGDCFLVYPNARSSIRFERLREGIQDWEKIRILREMGTQTGFPALQELEELRRVLERVRVPELERTPAESQVNQVRDALAILSRRVSR